MGGCDKFPQVVGCVVVWRWLCCAVLFVLCFKPGVSRSVWAGRMGTLAVEAAAGFNSAGYIFSFINLIKKDRHITNLYKLFSLVPEFWRKHDYRVIYTLSSQAWFGPCFGEVNRSSSNQEAHSALTEVMIVHASLEIHKWVMPEALLTGQNKSAFQKSCCPNASARLEMFLLSINC